MRIIIESEEQETPVVREESAEMEEGEEVATDAGAAPTLHSESRYENVSYPASVSTTEMEITDAGAAPRAGPEFGENVSGPSSVSASETDATNAGAAPTRLPELVRREVDGSSPVPATGSGTDAGPPSDTLLEAMQLETEDMAIDYTALVEGTVSEVQERVETGNLDSRQVLEAERAGEARTTLIEWLEQRIDEETDG